MRKKKVKEQKPFPKPKHNFQTLKIMLHSIVRDEGFLEDLRNVVDRGNKIVSDALLFIKAYILHSYEIQVQLPRINKQLIRFVIKVMGYTQKDQPIRGKNKTAYEAVENFYKNHFLQIYVHKQNDRYLMINVEEYLIRQILRNIETNLKTHYAQRLKKFIRMSAGEFYDDSKGKKKHRKKKLDKLVYAIMWQKYNEIDVFFKVWFKENCKKYTDPYTCGYRVRMQFYLKRTIQLCEELEERNTELDGEMARIDEDETYEKLLKVQKQLNKLKNKLKGIKKARRVKNRLDKIRIVEKKIKKKEHSRKLYNKQSETSKLMKQKYKLFNVLPLPNFNMNYITLDTTALNKIFTRDKKTQRKLTEALTDNQYFIWNQFFNMKHKIFQDHSIFEFDYMIRTDGVGCSLYFRKKGLDKGYKADIPDEEEYEFPYIGSLTPKQIMSYDKVLTDDPGKWNLNYIAAEEDSEDGDIESYSERQAEGEVKLKVLKQTARQRRAETKSTKCQKILEKEKPKEVVAAELELSKCCSKTIKYSTFCEYLKVRAKHEKVLTSFYQQEVWRKWRFRKFSNKQRSEDNFLNKIEDTFGSNLLIVLGNWSQSNVLKNGAPTLGVGNKKLLAKKFATVLIHEHRTSKLCCGCHEEVEDVRIDGKKIFRLLGCKNCNSRTTSETPRTEKVYSNYKYTNRDTNSVRNMMYIVSEMVQHNMQRPSAY